MSDYNCSECRFASEFKLGKIVLKGCQKREERTLRSYGRRCTEFMERKPLDVMAQRLNGEPTTMTEFPLKDAYTKICKMFKKLSKQFPELVLNQGTTDFSKISIVDEVGKSKISLEYDSSVYRLSDKLYWNFRSENGYYGDKESHFSLSSGKKIADLFKTERTRVAFKERQNKALSTGRKAAEEIFSEYHRPEKDRYYNVKELAQKNHGTPYVRWSVGSFDEELNTVDIEAQIAVVKKGVLTEKDFSVVYNLTTKKTAAQKVTVRTIKLGSDRFSVEEALSM